MPGDLYVFFSMAICLKKLGTGTSYLAEHA
jgi:hypothetical protein